MHMFYGLNLGFPKSVLTNYSKITVLHLSIFMRLCKYIHFSRVLDVALHGILARHGHRKGMCRNAKQRGAGTNRNRVLSKQSRSVRR